MAQEKSKGFNPNIKKVKEDQTVIREDMDYIDELAKSIDQQYARKTNQVKLTPAFENATEELTEMAEEYNALNTFAQAEFLDIDNKPGIPGASTINSDLIIETDDNKQIVITPIESDPDEWVTIKAINSKPDREKFMVNAFNKAFPSFAAKVSTYEMVGKLASRSKAIADWLADAATEYANSTQLPLYLEDKISPAAFIKARDQMKAINAAAEARSSAQKALAEKYKEQLAAIDKLHDDSINAIKMSPVTRALSIRSTEMPISLVMAVENYVPAKAGDPVSKKAYAREVLVKYRVAILEYVITNKIAKLEEVNNLIDSLRSK